MNVFYFSSDLYASIAAVSILSLLENNKTIDYIHFFIADDGIKEETKVKLAEMINKYNADIQYIPLPDPSELLDFPFKDRYQIGHSYPRMCIARLLPKSIDRVLILDSDTLVLGDLGNLWNMNMGDNILAGVADCMNLKAFNRQFALSDGQFYCNAGMFLVDLKKWRDQSIEDEIIKTIKENNGNVFFFEQTLMNYSCRGKIKKLHPRYNTYTLFYAFEYENLITWRHPTVFYNKRTVCEAVDNPKIIHFTRNFYMKSHPWKENSEHPMTEIYRNYMLMTPWKGLWKDNRTIEQEKRYILWHKIPQKTLCWGANIIYNMIRPLMWWRNE
ncbi:MAG: glycosyltransferase family 8 protein [Lachnospiraceae bacterium]|nr:glycosyltransferase family 8 protein [Lachnospiraceae bacterium]